jgi:hypothetical protein
MAKKRIKKEDSLEAVFKALAFPVLGGLAGILTAFAVHYFN